MLGVDRRAMTRPDTAGTMAGGTKVIVRSETLLLQRAFVSLKPSFHGKWLLVLPYCMVGIDHFDKLCLLACCIL